MINLWTVCSRLTQPYRLRRQRQLDQGMNPHSSRYSHDIIQGILSVSSRAHVKSQRPVPSVTDVTLRLSSPYPEAHPRLRASSDYLTTIAYFCAIEQTKNSSPTNFLSASGCSQPVNAGYSRTQITHPVDSRRLSPHQGSRLLDWRISLISLKFRLCACRTAFIKRR